VEAEMAEIKRREMERQRQEWEAADLREKQRVREAEVAADDMRKRQAVEPERMRQLRELIRQKYELDVEIWSMRKVKRWNRHKVEAKMEKADEIYAEIISTVRSWDGNPRYWKKHEWKKAQEVQRRLQAPGKRVWKSNPPWEEE